MGGYRYFTVFMLAIISFLGISLLLSNAGDFLFIKELYFLLFLLIIAGIALLAINKGLVLGWVLFTLLFLTFLFNSVYLYLTVAGEKTVFYVVLLAASLGFLISVHHTKRKRCIRRINRSAVEIEDIHDAEVEPEIEQFKDVKRTVAATVARKTTKKAKKTTKKKAKKKTKKTKKKINRKKAA